MEDGRVKFVFLIAFLCVFGSVVIYFTGHGLHPETFFGAVFASWVGGLVLFIITGLIIFAFSIARPEHESFDARARILFRRQTGKHIDYIVERIKGMLEHYAERAVVKITISDFNVDQAKYRVSSLNTVAVRSYLDDVETTWDSHIGRDDVTDAPPGGAPCRLVFLRMDGEPVGLSEDFVGSFTRPINCRIDRNAVCEVSWLMEYWVQANDEPNTYTPRRYTQTLILEVENLMSDAVELSLTTDGTNWANIRLAPGVSRQVAEIRDIRPQTVAFDYRIVAP